MSTIRRTDLAPLLARFPFDQVRLLLFAGSDMGASLEAAREAATALADPADPMSLSSIAAEALKADPGRLADEAAAVAMFGGRRVIRVDGASDANATEAVALLLAAPAAGNPVVMLAGDLPKTSALRKAAEAAGTARYLHFYPMDQREARQWTEGRARILGLTLAPGVADRLVESASADIGVIGQELEKFALFLDAAPGRIRRLDSGHLALLGAAYAEEDLAQMTLAIVSGQLGDAARHLAQLPDGMAIPALRALARRLALLRDLRAAIDAGAAPMQAAKALRPPIFWRDQQAMADAAARWPRQAIDVALARMLAAESAIKSTGSAGDILGREEIAQLAAGAHGTRPLGARRPRA